MVALQRSVTPEDMWHALRSLLEAVTPGRYYVLGLPSLGIVPMFLRTTMPMRNMVRFAELAPLNRVVATSPGLVVARMSDFYAAAPGDPFHDEFLVPDGWLHAAALNFWDRDRRFIGHLASLRSREQGDFSEADLAHLRELHPPVNAAVLRLLDLQRASATRMTLEHSLQALPLPLAVVDWDLSVTFVNRAGRAVLHTWHHGAREGLAMKAGADRLPDDLRAACSRLKDSMSDAVRAFAREEAERETVVEHPCEPGLRATVRIVEPTAGRAMQPAWILHFEAPQAAEAEVTRALGQLARLSEAEKAIVRLAGAGHDNAAIAERLGRSPSTVRTHLRSVFRKLGISSRARLAPLLEALRAVR